MKREILAASRAACALMLLFSGAAATPPGPATQDRTPPSAAPAGQAEVPLSTGAARDVTDAGRAFIEVIAARKAYFVREPIEVRVRFGIERGLLQANLVQMFRQELDVPVRIEASWLDGLSGAKLLDPRAGAPERELATRSVVLNDRVGRAEAVADRVEVGREFAVFEIARSFVVDHAGELAIPRARLSFAIASRFEEDFVHGRVAVDKSDVFVQSTPVVLEVQPLPEAGRPADFSGAVGRFTVHAEVSTREIEVGQSLKLVLTFEGLGDVASFHAPVLADLAGFQVYGTVDASDALERRITYDIAPTSERVREVPSIAFVYFDPGEPAGYRTARTQPMPITVRARADRGGQSAAGEPSARGSRGLSAAALAVIAAAALGVIALAIARGARRRRRERAHREFAGRAAATFHERVAAHPTDLAQALTQYLAARLDCSRAAVVGSDVRARLIAAGVRADLASRVALIFERSIAARYGGALPAESSASVRALVDELEAAWPRST